MTPWLQSWIPFLFGTPKRTIITVCAVVVILSILIPMLAVILVNRILSALAPFAYLLLLVAVVGYGFKSLIKGSGQSDKGKRKR